MVSNEMCYKFLLLSSIRDLDTSIRFDSITSKEKERKKENEHTGMDIEGTSTLSKEVKRNKKKKKKDAKMEIDNNISTTPEEIAKHRLINMSMEEEPPVKTPVKTPVKPAPAPAPEPEPGLGTEIGGIEITGEASF